MVKEVKVKLDKKQAEHYVNNKEFSLAVVEYVRSAKAAKKAGTEVPRISNYIGSCLMKICEGLSHKPNFAGYSYRDEMVMDATENCVKNITNFDRGAFEDRKEKVTQLFVEGLTNEELEALGKEHGSPAKSVKRWYGEWIAGALKAPMRGLPNAFAYFTQIAYFAFLRRIAKEKKQTKIKLRYIESASIGSFAEFGGDECHGGDSLIEKIRGRTSSISHKDDSYLLDDDEKRPTKRVMRGWKPKESSTGTLFD